MKEKVCTSQALVGLQCLLKTTSVSCLLASCSRHQVVASKMCQRHYPPIDKAAVLHFCPRCCCDLAGTKEKRFVTHPQNSQLTTFAYFPTLTGLIKQLLRDVDWGGLDLILVDTPPGTTDEHLSIVQVDLMEKQAYIDCEIFPVPGGGSFKGCHSGYNTSRSCTSRCAERDHLLQQGGP